MTYNLERPFGMSLRDFWLLAEERQRDDESRDENRARDQAGQDEALAA